MNDTTKEIKTSKVDIETFDIKIEKITEKFKLTDQNITKINDEFYFRDVFFDKYLPLSLISLISDFFHNSLENSQKSKLVEYERQALAKLNKDMVENIELNRETQVGKIMENLRKVEERNMECMKQILMNTKPVKPKRISKNKEDSIIEPNSLKIVTNQTLGDDLDYVENFKFEKLNSKVELELEKIKKEAQKNFEKLAGNIKISKEENGALVKQVLSEIVDINTQRTKEKTELSKDFETIKTSIKDSKTSLKSHDEVLDKITKMIVCLVENAQIQQALEAQDEEDRHAIANNLEKDLQNELIMSKTIDNYSSAVPSAKFSLKKNCLSCGSATSMLSGLRTSVLYQPTPLFYREKVYQRPELIAIKGKLIKTFWDSLQLA